MLLLITKGSVVASPELCRCSKVSFHLPKAFHTIFVSCILESMSGKKYRVNWDFFWEFEKSAQSIGFFLWFSW